MTNPEIKCFFHNGTSTCTYVVHDPDTKCGMIIDPVMDFDMASGKTWDDHNDKVSAFCEESEIKVDYIVETHVHADHLTGANGLKEKFPNAQTAVGEHVTKVQSLFKQVFNLDTEKDNFPTDGSQFDLLLKDGETFSVGNLTCKVLHSPGHTPACICLHIGDAVFTGDTMFMPDMGTARCDFPGGSVHDLYESIQRLYRELDDSTRVFVGHDYGPGGREIAWETTIGEEKQKNKQLSETTGIDDFAKWRSERDSSLGAPKLLIPSLQINLRNGMLPEPESNGTAYLKLPLNALGKDPEE